MILMHQRPNFRPRTFLVRRSKCPQKYDDGQLKESLIYWKAKGGFVEIKSRACGKNPCHLNMPCKCIHFYLLCFFFNHTSRKLQKNYLTPCNIMCMQFTINKISWNFAISGIINVKTCKIADFLNILPNQWNQILALFI